jgi:FkbM family methyltransferase
VTRHHLRHIVEAILEQIPYLEKEMFALRMLVSPGDVCFDVGAAGGTYMWLLARRCAPDGRVYAFEPRPRSASAIERARRLLGLGNVSVHRFGLADREGSMTVLIPSWRGLRFTTRAYLASAYGVDAEAIPEGFTAVRPLTIPMTTIDQFVAEQGVERIDFIKADVEGAELAVMEGARQSIDRWHPTILLEIEDRHLGRYGRRATDVVQFMTERGYRMHTFGDGALRPTTEVVGHENNYLFLA